VKNGKENNNLEVSKDVEILSANNDFPYINTNNHNFTLGARTHIQEADKQSVLVVVPVVVVVMIAAVDLAVVVFSSTLVKTSID